MQNRRLSILTFAIATAFCTAAVAQPSPSTPSTGAAPSSTAPGAGASISPPGTMDFNAIDADGDGYISRAEATGVGLGGKFTALDKNNDSRLDRSEFAAHRGNESRAPGMQSGTSAPPTSTMTR